MGAVTERRGDPVIPLFDVDSERGAIMLTAMLANIIAI